jgi:hypothetical protein
VFSGLSSLVIDDVADLDGVIVVRARTAAGAARCPRCGGRTGQVHGYYERTVADVPADGRPVVVRVRVRRMRCPVPGCPVQTFREQVPGVLDRYQRRTTELLDKAPDPARAAKLTRARISAVLKRAGRYKIAARTDAILAALRSPQLGQPPALTAAYAATARSLIAVIATLNDQIAVLQGQVEAHFGQHPDAEIYLSQPGLGAITGARVLAEFGDDPDRYACAKARRNYAATSPITRASGKKKIVAARFVHNDRLIDALMIQAFAALRVSPGARTFYDDLHARGIEHNDALRRLANRLVGILHGCLKARTCYDETTAWGHRENTGQSPVAA